MAVPLSEIPLYGFSTFKNKNDNQPVMRQLSLHDLVKSLTTHKPRSEKDGQLWSPAAYKPQAVRGVQGVEFVTCAVFDIDDGTPPDSICYLWKNKQGKQLAYCIYSSYSSTSDKPKYRLVFFLAEPVSAADWPRIWAKLNVALTDGHCDPACKDVSRIYYTPSCPVDKLPEAFADFVDGELLNPSDYPDVTVLDDAATSMRWVSKRVRIDNSGSSDSSTSPGLSTGKPGEDYNERGDDQEVLGYLTGAGWTIFADKGGRYLLQRPGKTGRDFSATYGYDGMTFYCFTSNGQPFEPNTHYTKFAVFALTQCNGDFSEAARQLAARGFGEQNTHFLYERGTAKTDKTDITPYSGWENAHFTHEGGTDKTAKTDKTSPPRFDLVLRPLSMDLLPVPKLDLTYLPCSLREWVADIAERGCFPLEYVAAPVVIAIATLVGRTVGIRPKLRDTWTVCPNLWGAIIGPPGVQKTPAVSEAFKPLDRLEVELRRTYEAEKEVWEVDQLVDKAAAEASGDALKKAAKRPGVSREELRQIALGAQVTGADEQPTLRRLRVNDATTEKLGELLNENPNGLLLWRDELTGWLKTLDKQGREGDRAFYLEAWNGLSGYTFDRISRGTVSIPALCLSVFGTIQPGPLLRYLQKSASGDEADGLMPRFQLLVYPDPPRDFVNVDRWPLPEAKNRAYAVFQHLANLSASDVEAETEEGSISFLRFTLEAQEVFDSWRVELEQRLRSATDTPLMVTHLSKYRSLLPSLALLFHLADGNSGPVTLAALELGLRWCEFLEAHARRIYQGAMDGNPETAQQLGERLKQSLPNPFTARDVYRKGWAGLGTPEEVDRAVSFLEERGWVQSVAKPSTEQGARPTTQFFVNPALFADSGKDAS